MIFCFKSGRLFEACGFRHISIPGGNCQTWICLQALLRSLAVQGLGPDVGLVSMLAKIRYLRRIYKVQHAGITHAARITKSTQARKLSFQASNATTTHMHRTQFLGDVNFIVIQIVWTKYILYIFFSGIRIKAEQIKLIGKRRLLLLVSEFGLIYSRNHRSSVGHELQRGVQSPPLQRCSGYRHRRLLRLVRRRAQSHQHHLQRRSPPGFRALPHPY